MTSKYSHFITILCVGLWLGLVLTPTRIQAGFTGKISGKVISAETQKPLAGVNIILTGTGYGAATDDNGLYFILNIPPGKYTVRAEIIGYRTEEVTNVQVVSDYTTELNFSLSVSPYEIKEKVVVTASRPLLQKDATSKILVLDSRSVTNMPVESFEDILSTQAGFTRDASGNLHVRGGRSGEIAYLIDGIPVTDPLGGGINIGLNDDAIQELVVISGTFNAEYGEIMSGVVNVITREGGDAFHGKLEYTSPMLNPSPYRKKNPFSGVSDSYSYEEFSIYDKHPLPGIMSVTLSGSPIHKFPLFLAYRRELQDSYLPHGYNFSRELQSKLNFNPFRNLKLTLQGLYSAVEYQGYNHKWKYLPEHQTHSENTTSRFSITANHTLSPRSFQTFIYSGMFQNLIRRVGKKKPRDYVRRQTGVETYFYVSGDDASYRNDTTMTHRFKWDWVYQYNSSHQIKCGLDYAFHDLKVHEQLEPWQGGIQFKENYRLKPVEFAAYAQDKIELDYIILNLGVRLDWAHPKAEMWEDIRKFGAWDSLGNWIPAPMSRVEPRMQISPRMGIAYPVTDKMVFHFSYGRFFQNPDYSAQYYNYEKDLSSTLALVGNPRVKAQKTVAYETGIKYEINPHLALDFSAWYKDVSDLLSTQEIRYLSNRYVAYVNTDYAGIKGFDLTLRKRFTGNWGASLDYTYSVARGNNSDPLGGYFDAFEGEEIPHREYYLDFDQRHDIACTLDLATPPEYGISLVGFHPFSNLNLNILGEVESGLPYTPYVDPTLRVDINSARKPWKWQIDIRFIKTILIGNTALGLYLDVNNLLDRRNVLDVYPRTGKPFDPGFLGVGTDPDANHDPARLGEPRIVKWGAQVQW